MLFITLLILILLLIIPIFFYNPYKVNETFTNPISNNNGFTTPVPLNIPADNNESGNMFYVGSDESNLHFEGPPRGKYNFRKQELLYDGIWGKNQLYNPTKKTMEYNWNARSSYFPLNKNNNLVYGENNFWKRPEKNLKMNEKIVSPPDCNWNDYIGFNNNTTFLEHYKLNKPCYLNKPTTEDILGYYPKDNQNYELPSRDLRRI